MKKTILSASLIILLTAALPALEIHSSMGWDNARFDPAHYTSLGATNSVFEPRGALFWSLGLEEAIGESFRVRMVWDRSSILRDRVETVFGVEHDIFSVYAGPFFAPFINQHRVLGSGLVTELQLRIPGRAFVSLRNDTSLGSGLTMMGDFYQSNSVIELGVWVPNVIVSARITLVEFIENAPGINIANDRRLRYDFITSFHKKNVPYTIEITLGYQELSRALNIGGTESRDTLHSFLTGMELTAKVTPKLSFFAAGEFYLLPWTSGGMVAPQASTPLFMAKGGMSITLPNIIKFEKPVSE